MIMMRHLQNLLNLFMKEDLTMYKIQVYIPLESVDTIREVITQAGGGRIGNYAGCMSWWQVHSSWTSLPGAHPYDGAVGETTETDEYILQCRVDDAHLSTVLSAIREAHPYEEPVIDVVKLWK